MNFRKGFESSTTRTRTDDLSKLPPTPTCKPESQSLVAGYIQSRMFRDSGHCARARINPSTIPSWEDCYKRSELILHLFASIKLQNCAEIWAHCAAVEGNTQYSENCSH